MDSIDGNSLDSGREKIQNWIEQQADEFIAHHAGFANSRPEIVEMVKEVVWRLSDPTDLGTADVLRRIGFVRKRHKTQHGRREVIRTPSTREEFFDIPESIDKVPERL